MGRPYVAVPLVNLYGFSETKFYDPEKALELYEEMLTDGRQSSKELSRRKSSFANFLEHAPEGIRDPERAKRLYEESSVI